MLSKKTKSYFIKSLKAASFLRCLPYKWDTKKQCVLTVKSKSHKILWTCCFLAEAVFEIFIIFRLIEASIMKQTTRVELINLRYKAVAYMLTVMFQITTVMRWEQFPIFVNSYIQFYDYLEENYKRKDAKYKNGCERVLPYIYYLGITIAALQSVVVVTRPEQVTLFSSLLQNPRKTSLLIRLPIACLHAYICFAFCFKMQVFTFTMLGYISPATLMIAEFETTRSPQLTIGSLRYPKNFMHAYRSMEYMQRIFNQVVAKVELPCIKFVLISVTVLGIYGCCRLDDRRVFVLAVVATASMMTLKATYQSMGNMHENSHNLLMKWKGIMGPDKVYRRIWKSLWAFKTRIGSFYIVDKAIVLVIADIVTKETIDVLLAF